MGAPREGGGGGERERERVCVCVCVRERERERNHLFLNGKGWKLCPFGVRLLIAVKLYDMINRGIQKWKSDQKDSITATYGSGESVEGLPEGGDELMEWGVC